MLGKEIGKEILVIGALASCFWLVAASDQFNLTQSNYSMIKRHRDGTESIVSGNSDRTRLIEKHLDKRGKLIEIYDYKIAPNGNLIHRDHYNAGGTLVNRVRYGYSFLTGKLKEAQLFDSFIKITHPQTGKLIPKIRYLYRIPKQSSPSHIFVWDNQKKNYRLTLEFNVNLLPSKGL